MHEPINREVTATLADPAIAARFAGFGSPILTGAPADLGHLVADDVQRCAKVIRAGNIRPE